MHALNQFSRHAAEDTVKHKKSSQNDICGAQHNTSDPNTSPPAASGSVHDPEYDPERSRTFVISCLSLKVGSRL